MFRPAMFRPVMTHPASIDATPAPDARRSAGPRLRPIALAALGVALLSPLAVPGISFAQADDAGDTAAAGGGDASAEAKLLKNVEDFWHYGKIANYTAANVEAKDILGANPDPLTLVQAFEAVAGQRGDDLDEWLLRWRGVDAIKQSADEITKIINAGRLTRRTDPTYIKQNITRLSTNSRAYRDAIGQLRDSGELAVPLMLATLSDPNQKNLHGTMRRAILDLGRFALNPLLAATAMKDNDTLPSVIAMLGDLGYDAAAPYLAKIAEDDSRPGPIREAARSAMGRLGGSGSSASLFYALSEKLYYDKSAIQADLRYPMASVWYWEEGKGLIQQQVPLPVFNEVMSMRTAADALAANAGDDALSLWLAANFKREAELPEGATDTTAPPNPAHYYGVTAGVKFLDSALSRALRDRNAAVALAAVKSLQDIVGESNAINKEGDSPVIEAMRYADRRVRFEAAFTLAQALPQTQFEGMQQVVPLLAEAMSQTGQPSVLVLVPEREALNALTGPMKSDNMQVAGGTTPNEAITAGANLPGVDVVVISDDLPAETIEQFLYQLTQTPKLRGAAKLFLVKTNASRWEQRKTSDPLIATTTATDAAGLKPEIEKAREQSGALPLDAEMAKSYATRAGELMKRLAISRGQVLDLTVARDSLLTSLNDARPEIVMLAGEVLGLLDLPQVQPAILDKATADATDDAVRVSLFKSIATNAKFFGPKLDDAAVKKLDQVVKSNSNADVRAAAGEARGALSLKASDAKSLILEQYQR